MTPPFPAPLPAGDRPLSAALGLDNQQSRAAPYLRALLAFAMETPGAGWVLKATGAALQELAGEESDQQLVERFDRLLVIGEQTNEDIAFLKELAAAIFLQQTAFLKRLREDGLSLQPHQLTAFAKSAALIAYRSRVAQEHQYVDQRGIYEARPDAHLTSLPLDDIYVLPELIPEREGIPAHERERELLRALVEDPDLPLVRRKQIEEEYTVLSGERWRTSRDGQRGGLPLSSMLSEARHAVVLGGPGVGKSTLSRYLVRTYALGAGEVRKRLNGWDEELTPVLIRLAIFADERSTRRSLSLREFLDETLAASGGEALRVALGEELAEGRAFFLLDGIDEVPEVRGRAAVVQAVDKFLADHSLNRFLIASRPYGYIRLAGDAPHFLLPNFSPTQVEAFVRGWQRAFESRRHPEAPNFDAAKAEAEALLAEINRNPKVAELATNPLMLVIVLLIRQEQARLPEERVQLYNRAVNTLMDTWNQWRSLPGKDMGGVLLPLARLVPVWGAIAEWTRRSKPTGVMHQAELKRELVCVLREHEFDEESPEATAESYLKAAAERAGLLEERAAGYFAFWHPTFEEFLAAVELATPTARANMRLLPLRDDPRWREVILLAVGYIGIVLRDGGTATEIVRAIADDAPSPLEPVLHLNLRLAAACIADDVGVKRTLAQEIIARLASAVRLKPYFQLEQVFVDTVRALPRLRPSPETVSALAPLAESTNRSLRMEAARLFSNVAGENDSARQLCEDLLDDQDEGVRCHAALGILRSADYRTEAWSALARFQRSDAHIEPAVRAFFTEIPPAALASLRSELLSAEDVSVRYNAAWLLHELGRAEEAEVVPVLTELLSADDAHVRLRAARLLHLLGQDEEAMMVPVLTELLRERNLIMAQEATKLLKHLSRAEEAIRVLTELLGDERGFMRLQAASMLHQLGRDEEVVRMLPEWLAAADVNVRFHAAWLVHHMFRAEEVEVVPALTELLGEEDLGSIWRNQVVWMLKEQSAAEEAIPALTKLLSAEDVSVRYNAAWLLHELGRAEEAEVVPVLTELLSADDAHVRFQAARLLHQLDRDEEVVPMLLEWLAAENTFVHLQAASLLVQIGRADQQVQEQVARIAEPQSLEELLVLWRRVVRGDLISNTEGQVLAGMLSVHPGDSVVQQGARRLLFSWLWEKMESPGVRSAEAR
jgi:HEAT repeat protein